MLYLDISSDKVYLSYQNEELFLERNGIENTLGKILIQRRRKYNFTKAYILNWPWGFTNLRVGSLCINLLNTLVENQIDLFSVSKIDLYTYGYNKGVVERHGIIYIGQKKNIRLRDFEKKIKIWQFSFDQLNEQRRDAPLVRPPTSRSTSTNNEHKRPTNNDPFLDIVYDQNYYPEFLRQLKQIDHHLMKQLLQEYVEEEKIQPTKHIEANYMIDPIIWSK